MGSGASKQFSPEMASDYKLADGWNLVYNTFSTSLPAPDRWYFILYNKYRGLLRMYYYIPPTANFITSSNITHTLAIEGSYASSSPMMNFAGQDVVDVNTKSAFASTVEQWQVAPATWYAIQYEIAYDQNMTAQNFSSFNFNWAMRSSQITDIVLNGTASGTLTGSIALPGSNFTISPSFSVDGSTNKSTITVNGSSDADKLKPSLGQTIVSNIKTALTSGLTGLAKNLLSGLFKKKNTTPDENVSLKLNANIALKGTLTSSFLITTPTFAIPGYDQGATQGILPAYPNALGVFYVSAKPVVNRTVQSTLVEDDNGRNYDVDQRYSINEGSFQLVFNKAVTDAATIANIKKEIVMSNVSSDTFGLIRLGGTLEQIGNNTVYTGEVTGIERIVPRPNPLEGVGLAVRITFDVVPKDGSAQHTIIKTFLASEVDQ